VVAAVLLGTASAANYMYEKATIKGVGYKNVETIIQTQTGLAGNKLVEKESGSGNVIIEKTEIEASRDYDPDDDYTETVDEYWEKVGDTGTIPPGTELREGEALGPEYSGFSWSNI